MQTTTGRLVTLIVALMLLLSPIEHINAQQSEPLQITVQDVESEGFPYVTAYATITDGRGIPIEGLAASAFILSEDGQPVDDADISVSPSARLDRPISLVLALDISHSLGEDGVTGVRNAALALLENLPPDARDRIALVTFGNPNPQSITVLSDFTDDHAALHDMVEEGVVIGPQNAYTAFWGAAYKALSLLEADPEAASSRRRAVIILTDGQDNSTAGAAYLPEDTQYSQDEVRAYARQLAVPIYPVSFGDQTDVDALEALAVATQGISYESATPRAIEDAFADVLAKLRAEYRIDFTSTLSADDAPHTLQITVAHQAYTAQTEVSFTATAHPVEVRLNLQEGETITGNVLIQPVIDAAAPIAYGSLRLNGALLQEFGAGDVRYTWNPAALAPGDYTLELFVRDAAGNTGNDAVKVMIVRPISIDITTPASGARLAGEVAIAVTVESNAADLNTITLLVDGHEVETITAPNRDRLTFRWDADAAAMGGHQIEVRARDTVGNEATTSLVVTVVEPITVQFTAPAANANVSGSVEIAYHVAANAAALERVTLFVDGMAYAEAEDETTLTWDAQPAALGAHTLELRARDTAGNVATDTVTVNVLRSSGLHITAPTEGARVAGAVAVNFDFAGDPADVDAVHFFVDDIELEAATAGFALQAGPNTFVWDARNAELGQHGLEVRVIDTLGVARSDTTFVTIVEPLHVDITEPTNGDHVNGEVSVVYTVEATAAPLASVALWIDGMVYTESADIAAEGVFTWDTAAAPLGAHTLAVVAVDEAGNAARAEISLTVVRTFGLHISAPATHAEVAGTVPVRFSLDAQLGDIKSAEFWVEGRHIATLSDLHAGSNTIMWDTTNAMLGLHQLEIRVVDATGATHTDTVVVNVVEALTVQIGAPAPNAHVNGAVSVTYEATANASALQSVALYLDGSEFATRDAAHADTSGTFTWDTTTAALGTHVLEIVVADADGNEAHASVSVTIDRAVQLMVISPAPGADVAGVVELRYTLEGKPTDIRSATFYVDDRRVSTLTGLRSGVNSVTWNADTADPGVHILEIRALDQIGTEINAAVTINAVAPLAVQITAPPSGAVVDGIVDVAYTVDARAALLYDVALHIDGVEVTAALPDEDDVIPAEGVLPWDTSGFALGEHTIEVIATDTDTHQATASTTARISRVLLVAIQAPRLNAPVAGSVEIRFALDGKPTDVARAVFLVDDRRISTIRNLKTGTNTLNWDASSADLGPHQLEIRLTDTLGSEIVSTVPVNVLAPLEVDVLAPIPNAEVAGEVAVSYKVAANAAALVRVALLVDGETVDERTTTPEAEGTLTWNTEHAAHGAHQLTLVAEDDAGETQSTTVSVEVVAPITLEVLAPLRDEDVAGVVAVRYRVETNAADLDHVTLLVDGAEVATAEDGARIAWDTADLAPGVHEVELRAVDVAGYEDAYTFSVNVRAPLIVRIRAPEPDTRVAGIVDIDFTVESNAAALAQVVLLVDGEEAAALEAPEAIDTIGWDARQAAGGQHELTVRAIDSAGNRGEASLSLTVAEPLTIDLTDPAPDANVTGRVSVRYRVVVTGAQLQTVRLKVNGETVETLRSPATQGVILWDTDVLPLGEHKLEVVAEDTVSNVRTAHIDVVLVRPLTVEIVAPEEDEQLNGVVQVRYQVSAALNEIARAALLVDGQEVEAVQGPLKEAVFSWDTSDLGAGTFELAVWVRDVTGAEQSTAPVRVQVIFQGNSLPWFILILLLLFIAAVGIPFIIRRRRATLAEAGVAAEGAAALTEDTSDAKAYLVSESGPTSGTRWLLAKSETIVGRSRTRADVVVTGRTASRQHARISRRGENFIYIDLKSGANPSRINGEPLAGAYTLQEGDVIEVGDTQLRFTHKA